MRKRGLALVAGLLAFALVLPSMWPAPARAQERERFSILRQLFQPRERLRERRRPEYRRAFPPAPRRFVPAERKQRPRRAAPRAAAAPVPPPVREPEAVAKADDARLVIVVGDFMGASVADGLAGVVAQDPKIRVLDKSSGSSGLVRTDVVDWPETLGKLAEAEKPAVLVAMLGSNDRQGMRVDGERQAAMSEAWLAEYRTRATALAQAARGAGVPLIWVGLPPFKGTKTSADMLAFNDLYREATEKAGGEFIDVWDGFADENGAFAATGPDINGQPVRLRGNDGINLTRAGKRKLAFYLEKPLSRLLGLPVGAAKPSGLAGDAPVLPAALPADAAPVVLDRTQPMALGAGKLAGETELLGTAPPQAAAGQGPKRVPGRADDFGGAN